MEMIAAGIVTYNPDIDRLNECILAIRNQVSKVYVFDNGSSNISAIRTLCTETGCLLTDNGFNHGIAHAYNCICRQALSDGMDWVMTLDQDSVCPANTINSFISHADESVTGIISPRINDRNIGDIEYQSQNETENVDFCISSASLLKLSVWQAVGGFWDNLFIDMVDFDFCWSVLEHGYNIVRVNSVSLLHELGHSKLKNFKGNNVAVFNHSPLRYYYIFRNTIAVGRKHKRRYQCLRWNLKRAYLIIRYESNRFNKLMAMFYGIIDGSLNRLGPCRITRII